MATLEEALVSYLQADTDLNNLIGTRIYHLILPETPTYPCLTMKRVETPREHTMDESGAAGNLAHPKIQFDAWAETFDAAKDVSETLRDALNGKTGTIGSGEDAVVICVAIIDDELSNYDETKAKFDSQSKYVIWHEE